MIKKRILTVLIAVLLTIATVRMMVRAIKPEALTTSLYELKWQIATLVLMLFGGVQWLRAWRFSLLTTGNLALPGFPIVSIAFRLNLLNFVVPFRVGELSYPILMHHELRQPYSEALGVLIVARIFDLAFVSALLLAFSAWFGVVDGPLRLVAATASVFLPILPVLLVVILNRGLHLEIKGGWLSQKLSELAHGVKLAGKLRQQIATLVLTAAVWLTYGIAAAIAAQAVTSDVSFAAFMFAAAAGNLGFVFPVNGIAGLGTSQAAWVLAASYAGISTEPAITSALVNYAISLTSATIGGGTCFAISMWSRRDVNH